MFGVPGGDWTQPLVLSSWRIRRRIMASGTRAPDFMACSALIPGFLVSNDWNARM